jgi:ribosomal protein S3
MLYRESEHGSLSCRYILASTDHVFIACWLASLQETISTCRFAQRVAKIQNTAVLNEEEDPQLVIGRLKHEVQQLKDQLQMATGEECADELNPEEREQ